MSEPTLSELREAVQYGVTDIPVSVVASDSILVAADHEDEWGAVMKVGASSPGEMSIEISLMNRSNSVWDEIGSSGNRYFLPGLPWTPPLARDWNGLKFECFGTTKIDIATSDNEDGSLLVIYGFATEEVESLLIEHDLRSRRLVLQTPLRPFVVAAVGHEVVRLTALGRQTTPVGPTQSFER